MERNQREHEFLEELELIVVEIETDEKKLQKIKEKVLREKFLKEK